MDLILTTEKNEAELTVHLSGELNTLTAPKLSGLLDEELDGVQGLVLDFAGCDYVSSAGIRILLAAVRKMKAVQGSVRLINVGEIFWDTLQDTGLDAAFDIQR